MLELSKNPLLTDVFPPTDPHNIGARILRRGLAVSAFSLLEAYLEERLEELTIDVITHRHFRRADRDEAPDFRAPLPGSPISESMCAWIALICSA